MLTLERWCDRTQFNDVYATIAESKTSGIQKQLKLINEHQHCRVLVTGIEKLAISLLRVVYVTELNRDRPAQENKSE